MTTNTLAFSAARNWLLSIAANALLIFAALVPAPALAAYAFVQQQQVSVATQTTPLTLPSITTTAGNALVVTVLATSGATVSLSGNGNTYTQAPTTGALDSGSSLALMIFYAQNINAGATVVVTSASPGSLHAVYVAEYSGLATSGLLVSSVGNFQAGPGSTANSVTSTSITNSVSAMLFGFTFPDNGTITVLPTAGTSPTAFTGRVGVWATLNGNATAPGIPEDAAISSSAASTFGSAAGALQFDNFVTVAAVFALSGGAPAVQPRMMLMGVGASLFAPSPLFHDIDPIDSRRWTRITANQPVYQAAA